MQLRLSVQPTERLSKEFVLDIRTLGRVIVQGTIRRVPIEAERVRTQVRSCEIYGGKSGTEAGFLRVLQFPLPILISQTAP
jgi:hypothetical protein